MFTLQHWPLEAIILKFNLSWVLLVVSAVTQVKQVPLELRKDIPDFRISAPRDVNLIPLVLNLKMSPYPHQGLNKFPWQKHCVHSLRCTFPAMKEH